MRLVADEKDHAFLQGEGPLYRRVADNLRKAMASGQFADGQKLPSTRQLKEQLGVSLSTIHQALRLLEAEGLLEIRPQSGALPRTPRPRNPLAETHDPIPVRRSDLTLRVLRETNSDDLLRLGGTIPNQTLMPTDSIRRRAARLARQGWPNRYDFTWGSPALRQGIARLSAGAGLQVDPDEVLLSGGCLESVAALLRHHCREGETVAVESPTFFGYLETLESLRLQSLEIPSSVQEGLCLMSLENALQRHKVSCLLLTPSFSNPQGACMSDLRKRQLMALASRYDLTIVENDISAELAFAERRPLALKAFDREGRVTLCGSFSKTLGPEWRIGWVIPGRRTVDLERSLTFHSFGGNSLVRQAVAEFLADGEYARAIRLARRVLSRQAASIHAVLKAELPAGSSAVLPQGGKMLWVELPPYLDALQLYGRCREAGIAISPGHLYSVRGHHDHCFRLNCSFFDEQVEQGLTTLCRLASQLASPRSGL